MDSAIRLYLNASEQPVWDEYVRLRDLGLRKQALVVLEDFVSRMELYPGERQREIVWAICHALFERRPNEDIVSYKRRCDERAHAVPYPLFLRIILPRLRNGYENVDLNAVRWLAQFWRKIHSLYAQSLAVLGLPSYSSWVLWDEALALDPNDSLAREHLIALYEQAFDYYVHELPHFGLLAESGEFREELDTFVKLASAQGVLDKYERDIAKWRFYCETWAEYLSRREEFANYSDYLERGLSAGKFN